MGENNFKHEIINAAKWSSFTEISAKLVSPVTNMILARILAPEAFGVIATITMIISFADMFTDSGFQKYLIQHEFKDEKEKYKNANVAFWTNFGISILLWIIIAFFRNELALLVGNPGLGKVLAIASFQLPLTSFSSIQMALYRREFNFKPLFLVRMVSVFIPFLVTIPLSFLGFNYWALIIGNIAMQISNALILTIKSKWKPKLFFSIKLLKEMFSFSIWSLIEAISIWLTMWIDSFIIGSVLSQHYLGIYKTSTSMVNTLMALITSAVVPVIFSTLSRLQNDNIKFENVFFKFQRMISIVVFPLGVGIYLYRDLITKILLGNQWSEANDVVGIWALTSSIMIVFGSLSSEVYRAKGRPKLSFLSQLLHLIVLIPACLISSRYGFWALVYTRSWIRLEGILVHYLIMKFKMNFPVMRTISNIFPTLIVTVFMGLLGLCLQLFNNSLVWDLISIILCIIFYFSLLLLLFSNLRNEIFNLIKKIIPMRYVRKLRRKLKI